MALINNGQILGSGSTDLILNTRGKIYVKVGDRFYELDFKNEGNNRGSSIINNTTINNPEQDLSPYVTKKYLKAALGEYVTKRNWEDIMQTKDALENAKLEGFTESITPITVNTMQMVVGTQNLQFDFIASLTDDTVVSPGLYINESGQLVCPKGFIKHYTLFGPKSVKPETDIRYYARWTINGDNGGDYALLDLNEEDKPYYVYLRVPTTGFESFTDDYVAEHINEDPKGGYSGNWFVSTQSYAIDEVEGCAYLLVALVTGSNAGGRSIGYLNGFTEILPGQITAYVFKTADGNQYLDFLNNKFRIGNNDQYIDWNGENLNIKGSLSVIGGDLKDTLDNLQSQIDDEIQCWFSTDSGIKQHIPLPNKDNKTANPNWPANKPDWVNKDHIGDLYYVVEDNSSTQSINEQGQAYRYIKDGDLYYWTRIVDNSISLALYNAYLAQQTANNAQNILNDIANDNVITIQEHGQLRELLNSVLAQCEQTIASADPYKDIQTVTAAISDLNTKKDTLSIIVNDILNQTDTYTISEEYREAWNNVFEALKNLSAEIAKKSNDKIVEAQKTANEAKNKFSEWADDRVISPLEVSSIETELNFINNDYLDQVNKRDTFGLSDTNEWKAYDLAYTNYKNSLQLVLDWWNNVADKTSTYPIPDDFNTNLNSYYETRLAFIKIALNASLITDVDYIKEALKGRTDVTGGLVLTGLIELGFGLADPNNENYYDSFRVMSGINGILGQKDGSENYTYTDPAIWFGGDMLDRENELDLSKPEVFELLIKDNNEKYYKYKKGQNEPIEANIYKWKRKSDGSIYYSLTESGQPFVNSPYADFPLQSISPQPFGNKYSFDKFVELILDPIEFKNSSGNTLLLQGTIQAYRVEQTSGEYIVYNIKNKTTEILSGDFHKCIVSSHEQSSSNNAINLTGSNIFVYSLKGLAKGVFFNIGNTNYYIECNPTPQNITGFLNITGGTSYPIVNVYERQDSETFPLYPWKYDNTYIYTLTDYTEKPDGVYLLSNNNIVQYAENYTVAGHFDNLAKSMFRMDGSGYLADGNISWNTDGKITMNEIDVKSGNVGPLVIESSETESGKVESSVKVKSGNINILNITNDSVSINGTLETKSDWGDRFAITISDPLDVQIFSVSAQSLSTDNIPTYVSRSKDEALVYWKGPMLGGTVTIPKNAWYPILEPQYVSMYSTYTITNFELKYNISRISKPITMHIYAARIKETDGKEIIDGNNKVELYTRTWSIESTKGSIILGNLDNNSFSILPYGLEAGKWGVYLYLEQGGQVKSGVASDSWIRFWATTNNKAKIILDNNSDPKPGTFIGSNGISSIFGKNTKFQWIVPNVKNTDSEPIDSRNTGGIFYVEVPFNEKQDKTVGLRVVGCKGVDGSAQTPGIQFSVDGTWHGIYCASDGSLRWKEN